MAYTTFFDGPAAENGACKDLKGDLSSCIRVVSCSRPVLLRSSNVGHGLNVLLPLLPGGGTQL